MDPLVGGSLIAAGGSLINGLLGGLLSSDQQSTSLAMNRESQRWQSAEWSRRFGIESDHQWSMYNQQMQDWYKMQSRTYQDNLSLQQRLAEFNMDLEREEYDRRMNAYQTPEAQARMLMEAGYNPLLAQGVSGGSQPSPSVNGGSGMSSPGFPGMPQSPNPGDPSAYGVTPTQVGSSQMLEAVSNMIEKLSVAAKNGMDTYEAKTLLQEKLRSFILQNNGQELLNYSQKIDNFVNENIKNTKVKRAFQEYQNSIVQELLFKNMADKEAADTLLKFSQKFFTDIESKVKGEDLFQLKILSQHYESSILAYIRNLKSSSVKNTAEASEAYAHAKELQEVTNVHKYQEKLLGVQIDREVIKRRMDEKTFESAVEKAIAVNKLDASKVYYELDKVERLISAQESSDTWAEINTILYHLKNEFPSIFSLVVGAAMVK